MPFDGNEGNGAVVMDLKRRTMLHDPRLAYSDVEVVIDPGDGSVLLHQEPDDGGDIVILSRAQWQHLAAILRQNGG